MAKIIRTKKVEAMAQAVECLPGKCKALCSNLNIEKTNRIHWIAFSALLIILHNSSISRSLAKILFPYKGTFTGSKD
jgi:hypothetical protein